MRYLLYKLIKYILFVENYIMGLRNLLIILIVIIFEDVERLY